MLEQLDPVGTSVTSACSYSPADKGYVIGAAVWAGANLDKEAAPMLFDRGIVAPGVDGGYVASDSAFGGKAFPGPIRQYNPGTQPFLKVNRNGERFANESSPYNDIVYAAAHQPGRVYAQICDANILEDAKRFHTIGCSAQTRNAGEDYIKKQMENAETEGCFFKADTIEELAALLDVPADELQKTIDRYNELCDQGTDADFGKKSAYMHKIEKAPFWGVRKHIRVSSIDSGVNTNANGQALDADGKVIDGLYCVGNVGGVFYGGADYPFHQTGLSLGRCYTFGMLAAKHAMGQL